MQSGGPLQITKEDVSTLQHPAHPSPDRGVVPLRIFDCEINEPTRALGTKQ